MISKCGIQLESESRKNSIKHYDYSTSHIIASVEQSLRNLRTEYLDLLLLHRPSPLMEADEIGEAVVKLKNDGKILDFGVSNFTPKQSDLIETQIKINFNQIEFSITNHEAMLNGSLDHMKINNITPMCWSPLGTVFKKDEEKSHRLKKLATSYSLKYDVPIDVVFLAWILKHPSAILPVCGTSTQSRIKDLMKATTVDMELQDWFELWSVSSGNPAP